MNKEVEGRQTLERRMSAGLAKRILKAAILRSDRALERNYRWFGRRDGW